MRTLCNFRDLGGIVCAGGHALPSGLLFRSEAPALDASDDINLLRRLGVRTFVDLRSPEETPSPLEGLPASVAYVSAGLRRVGWEDSAVPPDHMARFLAGRYLMLSEEALGDGKPLGRALAALMEPSWTGRIVWCAGGKDRTGIVVAIFLHLLGASYEDIAEDFARSAKASAELLRRARRNAMARAASTQRRDSAERRRALRASVAAFPGGLGALSNPAPPEAITLFLEQLTQRHGGVRRYAERAGLGTAAVSEIKRAWFGSAAPSSSSTAYSARD